MNFETARIHFFKETLLPPSSSSLLKLPSQRFMQPDEEKSRAIRGKRFLSYQPAILPIYGVFTQCASFSLFLIEVFVVDDF